MQWLRSRFDDYVDKQVYPLLYKGAKANEDAPTGHRIANVGPHRVRCLCVCPRSVAPKKSAVWLHGNSVTLADLAKSGLIQKISDSLQYQVYCPDYSNARSARSRGLDTMQVLHAQSVIEAVTQESPSKVSIFGRSLGAAIALRAVAEAKHDVASAIDHVHLVSPFSSLDALMPSWALSLGLITPNRFDSVAAVQSIMGHTRFSLYHGDADMLISPVHSKTLHNARENARWITTMNSYNLIEGMTHDPMPQASRLVDAIVDQCDTGDL